MWLMVFVSKLVLKHMDDEGVKAIVAMAKAIDRIK